MGFTLRRAGGRATAAMVCDYCGRDLAQRRRGGYALWFSEVDFSQVHQGSHPVAIGDLSPEGLVAVALVCGVDCRDHLRTRADAVGVESCTTCPLREYLDAVRDVLGDR